MGAVCLAYEHGTLSQGLNSYSYAEDNPITKSDPSGKCLEDGCIIEGVAAVGFVVGIASQAFDDAQTGAFGQRSLGQNLATYGAAGAEGAFVRAKSGGTEGDRWSAIDHQLNVDAVIRKLEQIQLSELEIGRSFEMRHGKSKSVSLRRGMPSKISATLLPYGNVCSFEFLVSQWGSVIVCSFSLIQGRRRLAISPSRCPVSASN
jgi:hypothetical protein